MKLATGLLLVVLLTHYGYPVLAHAHPDPATAARAWFYVLRGVEGAVLFAVLGVLLKANEGAAVVCWWGCVEESQTAVCRLSSGIDNPVTPELMQGLCGAVTGLPVWELSLTLALYLSLKLRKGGAWSRPT